MIRTRSLGRLLAAGALIAAGACTGNDGPQGPAGEKGPPGPAGATGAAGPGGATGVAGPTGGAGPTGPTGGQGAQGPAGTNGRDGTNGTNGTTGRPGLNAGETPGIRASITLQPPANMRFYDTGQRIVFRLSMKDRFDVPIAIADFSVNRFVVQGPKDTKKSRTAAALLGVSATYPAAGQRTIHHYLDLTQPPAGSLVTQPDGTLVFTTLPIGAEEPGTYTASLWLMLATGDQTFVTSDFQVKTAAVEPEPMEHLVGTATAVSCGNCHLGPDSQKYYLHHVDQVGSGRPLGNWALDSAPLRSCRSCHNTGGYSRNPIVLKVHGVHRGANMKRASYTNPNSSFIDADRGDYNDLSEYADVVFPVFPGAERNCTACHQNDVWKTKPSRLACGSCHDALDFATARIDPPRSYGRPNATPCTNDGMCSGFGPGATCEPQTGNCVRTMHPAGPQGDDTDCRVCHTASAELGIAPIPVVHRVPQDAMPGVVISFFSAAGGTGASGSYRVGDRPSVTVRITNRAGVPMRPEDVAGVTGDVNRPPLSLSFMMYGPAEDRHRVIPSTTINLSTELVTVSATAGLYRYQVPASLAIGANGASPLNTLLPGAPNVPGTYTLVVYGFKQFQAGRDSGSATRDVLFGGAARLDGEHTVTQAKCNGCHVNLQFHGGSRLGGPELCMGCHNSGAVDRAGIAGGLGNACTRPADCASSEICLDHDTSTVSASRCVARSLITTSNECTSRAACKAWEGCIDHDANAATAMRCTMVDDPTGATPIDFRVMIHKIHRGRYLEREFGIIGYSNTMSDFSEVIFPVDIRNCTKCHATDEYENPAAKPCLSCHDSESAQSHALLNTYDPTGTRPSESCRVCHGPGKEFAVEKMHAVSNPYRPPYPREREE